MILLCTTIISMGTTTMQQGQCFELLTNRIVSQGRAVSLIHFQRYILSKGPLPLDIEFDLQDSFANLRPNMTRYATMDEVNTAILQLEEREIGEKGAAHKEESDSDSGSGSGVRGGQKEELDDGNHERGSGSDNGDDYDLMMIMNFV